jgi:CRP-like cAMP-binding protein
MSIVNELEVFGLEEILNERVYSCTATSLTESVIICIPSEAFSAIINPIYTKRIYDNIVSLVTNKRSILEKSRHLNSIYKESMQEMMSNDIGNNLISQRLQELS